MRHPASIVDSIRHYLPKIRQSVGGRVCLQRVLLASLLILCVARLAQFIWHDPLLALANNYDMIRIQSCHQIWPADPGIARGAGTYEAPLEFYQRSAGAALGICYPSTELIYTSLLELIVADGESFSIRRLMIIKATLVFSSLLILVIWLARKSPGAALLVSLAFCVVYPDPLNSLYLGTFYTEASALHGFAIVAIALTIAASSAKSVPLFMVLFAGALLLGLSRGQHLVMPLVAVLALLLCHSKFSDRGMFKGAVVALALAAMVTLFLQMNWLGMDKSHSMRQANATNIWLYTVLDMSGDPDLLTANLGLPDKCSQAAGRNWYSPGLQQDHPCPEVYELSRLRLFALPWYEPAIVLRIVKGADAHLRPLIPRYIGHVAGANTGHYSAYLASVVEPLDSVPLLVLWLLIAIATAPALYGVLKCNAGQVRALSNPGLVFVALTIPVVLAVSIAGDGFIEIARHSHLAINAILISLLVQALLALRFMVSKLRMAAWRQR